jgi:hypothetical protein
MGRFLLLVILLFICPLTKAGTAPTNMPPLTTGSTNNYLPEISSGISVAKDVVNILFFIAAGTIAILSYRQAKKTLFAPIRAETFKLQLKAFEEVLLFFEKHSSLNIDDEFDFYRILHANAIKMLDSYAFLFFANKIKKDEVTKRREQEFQDLGGVMMSQAYVEKNVELMDYHLKQPPEKPEALTEPALILAKWQAYDHGAVYMTKKFENSLDRLHRFQVSPLLPKDLKALIAAFESEAFKNLHAVGEVLTSIAKQLPNKYPTLDLLMRADLSWIWNEYNRNKYSRLKDKQDDVLKYLEGYLQINDLLGK